MFNTNNNNQQQQTKKTNKIVFLYFQGILEIR